MNWMIDGAHGDLYRSAMGYPRLHNATDEWEIERNLGRASRPRKPLSAAFRSRLAAAFAKLSSTFQSEPTAQEKLT